METVDSVAVYSDRNWLITKAHEKFDINNNMEWKINKKQELSWKGPEIHWNYTVLISEMVCMETQHLKNIEKALNEKYDPFLNSFRDEKNTDKFVVNI